MSDYSMDNSDICGWVGESLIKSLEGSNEVIRKKSSVTHIKKEKIAIEKRLGCGIEIIKLDEPKKFLIRKIGGQDEDIKKYS